MPAPEPTLVQWGILVSTAVFDCIVSAAVIAEQHFCFTKGQRCGGVVGNGINEMVSHERSPDTALGSQHRRSVEVSKTLLCGPSDLKKDDPEDGRQEGQQTDPVGGVLTSRLAELKLLVAQKSGQ